MKGFRIYPGVVGYPHRPDERRLYAEFAARDAVRFAAEIAASDAPDVVKQARAAAFAASQRHTQRLNRRILVPTVRKHRAERRYQEERRRWLAVGRRQHRIRQVTPRSWW
jgi:hypothetical protein